MAGLVVRVATSAVALCACGKHAPSPDAYVTLDAGQPFFGPAATYPAVDQAAAVAVGDVDGDGKLDIVVAGAQPASVAVLLGQGGGAFGPATIYPTSTRFPSAIIAVDFNGDGRADVAVTDAASGVVLVALSGPGGVLGVWASYPANGWPMSVASADINGDGHADLALAMNFGERAIVLLGDGMGGFTTMPNAAAGPFPMSVRIADIDGDGKLDLAIADQGPVQGDSTAAVLLGRGDGTFAAPLMSEVGNFPNTIAIGDLNLDGKPDAVITNEEDATTSVLLAIGGGAFAPQRRYSVRGWDLAIADLDGDGKPEILVASSDVAVLHNAGDGTFDTFWTVPCACQRIAIADVDGDGKPDLVGVGVEMNGALWNGGANTVNVLLHVP